MASDSISFTVTFLGVPHALSIPPATTLSELHLLLAELTGVPPALQKLLYKNKKSPGNNDVEQMTVTQAGLKDGIKVQLLGSTTQELDGLRTVENEHTRVQRILRERALKAPVKVSSPYSSVDIFTNIFSFDRVVLVLYQQFSLRHLLPFNIVSTASKHWNIFQIHHLLCPFSQNFPKIVPSSTLCNSINFLWVC
jgi:hypothetical protein